MLAKVKSAGIFGVEGYMIDVEVDISNGLPVFDIVGLPDISIRESKERVRAAIKNSGFEFPIADNCKYGSCRHQKRTCI